MMLFRPPRMPWEMVGARTVMPRTTPLYSRLRRPCTSNVVDTRLADRTAIGVTRASWRARPVAYHELELVETTYAARTMRWGGVIILLYVIYHLLDFTFGRLNPGFVPGDVYHNVVASFRLWPVSAFYIAAMLVVGLHIYHGVWSALQTLGLHRAPTDRWRRGAAGVLAAATVAGYVAIPLAVLAGWLR